MSLLYVMPLLGPPHSLPSSVCTGGDPCGPAGGERWGLGLSPRSRPSPHLSPLCRGRSWQVAPPASVPAVSGLLGGGFTRFYLRSRGW